MAKGKKTKEELTSEKRLAEALMTVAEQPHPVPENWCWTQLKWLIETSKEKTEDFSVPDVKYVGLEHIEKDIGIIGYSSTEGIKSLKNVFHAGQILYGKLRPYLNKHDVANFDGICSTDILVFNAKPLVLKQYINYYFSQQNFIEYVVANSKGINLPRVSESIVLDAPCPLPSFAEQQRIVDIIERLFAKLDEAKEKAQAVVDSFEIRKAAILHRAFTGELTVQWRSNNNISTDTWLQKKLSECTYAIGDGLHGTPLFSENEDYYFINGNNFSGEMIEIKQDTKSVDIHEFEKYRVPLSSDLTVFVSINGTLGKTAFYNGESIILGKSACYINVSEELNKYYLRYYLWSKDFVDYANRMATGSTIKNLGLKAMRNLLIPLPSLDEQAEIVRILDDLLNKEQQAKASAETVLDQIDTMKKAILARAFRGKLGTNDPTEESSIELLKENVRSYFHE